MPFNYLDVIIVGVTVLCFGLGLISGVIWQVAGIVSLVAGVVATILVGDQAGMAMSRWISHPGLATLVGYLGVFAVASLAVRILATVFSKLLEKAKLKPVDRFLGGAVGIAKAIVICAVVIIIMDRYGTTGTSQAVRESLLATPVLGVVDLVARKADEADVTEKGRRMIDRIQDAKDSFGSPPQPDAHTPESGPSYSEEDDAP